MKLHLQNVIAMPALVSTLFLAACDKPASTSETTRVVAEPRITGRVTDDHGVSIANALIKIENMEFQARTNQNGEYSVGFVPGHFALDVSADQYLSKKVQFDVSQVTNVPAAPTILLRMPNIPEWEKYLRTELPKQRFRTVLDSDTSLPEFAELLALTVNGFTKHSDEQVIGAVTARWRAKKNFHPSIVPRFETLFTDQPRRSGEEWEHRFRVRLKFVPPETWSWEETLRNE